MKKTEKLMILISVVLVSLLAIGAVSAADADATVIGDDTGSGDDSGFDEGGDSGLDDADKPAPKPIEKPTVTEPAGDFSDLDDKIVAAQINHDGKLELDGDYQNAGDEDGITIKSRKDEDNEEIEYKTLTIEGNHHTIDANGASTIFTIDSSMEKVIIQNLNFINAYTEDGVGGAIHNHGPLTLINVTFIDNTALDGGAIYNDDTGILDIENAIFINNTAMGDESQGGAIYTSGDLVDGFEKVLFINNSADYGGAVYSDDDYVLAMDYAVFLGNEALYGGAICVEDGILLAIDNAYFANNTADYNGGAICTGTWEANEEITALNNVTFEDNIAGAYGGAIYSESLLFAINNATFENNRVYAPSESAEAPAGGAIYGAGLILEINNATFTENVATNERGTTGNGGAISAYRVGISNSEFEDNEAVKEGGAIQTGYIEADNVLFEGNTAEYGGAIFIVVGNIEDEDSYIKDSEFTDNEAKLGGAIFTRNGLTLRESEFTFNTAEKGGAIYDDGDSLTVSSSDFAYNGLEDVDYSYGGAIYVADGANPYLKVGRALSPQGPIGTFENDIAAYGSEIYVEEEVGADNVEFKTFDVINEDREDSIVVPEGTDIPNTVKFPHITSIDGFQVNNNSGNVAIIIQLGDDVTYDLIFGEPFNITSIEKDDEGIIAENIYFDPNEVGPVFFPEAYLDNDLAAGDYTLYIAYAGKGRTLAPSLGIIEFTVVNMTEVFQEVYDEGYDDGWDDGYDIGFDVGNETGYEAGYGNGTIDGYEAGYEVGFDVGNETGYETGYEAGYGNGTIDGYDFGYEVGFDVGNETGYAAGYNASEVIANATIKNLTDKNNNLTDKNNNLTAENAKLAGEKDAANQALAAKDKEATQLTADKAKLQDQVNTLNSQLTTEKTANTEENAKIKKVKAASKVKKSKNFKITVTLSSTKVNGKYVYVIFNGKSYKAKAKNGVAKITIKKSALKKLGGKKVKYQIVYNQSLKNKTVKIKK